MTDTITSFFETITASPQPALSRVNATIRFDIDENGNGNGGRHWLLSADKGTVTVAPADGDAPADAAIHTHRALFERLVTGRANAMAATLRGEVGVSGDGALLVAFQRLLPGPASTKDVSYE